MKKNRVQTRHNCALSGRKPPPGAMRQHLFPLSIKDGEGEEVLARYKFV